MAMCCAWSVLGQAQDDESEDEDVSQGYPYNHLLHEYFGPTNDDDYKTLCLSLRETCRQIYEETEVVFYRTSTFSFDDFLTFRRFMMTRSTHQRSLIRSLRFEMPWKMGCKLRGWDNTLSMPVLEWLSGLRSLTLYIASKASHKPDYDVVDLSQLPQCLQRLSTLPLTRVEVGITEREVKKRWRFKTSRWEAADKIR
ncbi:MAG: hypothetical protein LQ350_002434 [Teloschistes chrysophthalmus]|nr:MAG: hypothetical protein LQ350_002434 [Niorma chrysophthalma]